MSTLASADDYPLFACYDELRRHFHRLPLLVGPTPVQQLATLSPLNIWIKRDDQSSLLGGGTKVRKLELLFGQARAEGKSHLYSIGAVGSHHLLTLANFAHRFGFTFEAMVCDQPLTEASLRNLLLIHQAGAKINYGGNQVVAFLRFLRRSALTGLCGFAVSPCPAHGSCFDPVSRVEVGLNVRNVYPIFPGASSSLGVIGIVNAALELRAQIHAGLAPAPAVIVCALGSGGTLAGLTLGVRLAQLDAQVIGVRTYPSRIGIFPGCTTGRVHRLSNSTYALLRKSCPQLPEQKVPAPVVLDGYLGPGYAAPSPAGEHARQVMQEQEGIELDSTYTAKTFAAVLDVARQLPKGTPILYWHTFGNADAGSFFDLAEHKHLPKQFHWMFAPANRRAHGSQCPARPIP